MKTKNFKFLAGKLDMKKILRPKKYSKANSKHLDVLVRAIKEMWKTTSYPDIIIALLANAPSHQKNGFSRIVLKINILQLNLQCR